MMRVVIAVAAVYCAIPTLAAAQAGPAGRPAFTNAQMEAGRQLYFEQCASCHGSALQGAGGPALSGLPFRERWFTGQLALAEMLETIEQGMPPDAIGSISERQALESVAFILFQNGLRVGQVALTRQALAAPFTLVDNAAGPSTLAAGAAPRPARFPVAPDSAKFARTAVPSDKELLESRPQDWLLTNQDLRGQRFSQLTEITTENVAQLVPTCILQLGDLGAFQTRPIVYQGRMYITTTHQTVAMDSVHCTRLWEHTYVPKDREPLPTNRGAALYEGKVYRGTGDGHLLALDAETGEELWDVWVADSQENHFVAAAPLAFGGKVFVAEGGGDYPNGGHLHAFEGETGEHLWTFETIKDDPASWPPDSANIGGGGSWTGATLDPAAGLVYFPIGNPYPSYIGGGRTRPGDNLYTNSVVALDVDSGEPVWYAQQTPHDTHDWDTGSAPVLYDIGDKRFMAVASKNGFLHIYDRATHAEITRVPASRIKNHAEPVPIEGLHVCPGHYGGVAQNGQAYDPVTRMLFLSSIDWCDMFYDQKRPQPDPKEQAFGWVRAYDAATGKEAWATRTDTPMVAAVTPTAGGVLFTGDLDGFVLAFDSKTGKELYRFNTGGPIAGGIVTYEVAGKQYVAVPSGNVSRGVPWHTAGASPTLIVFALP